MKGRSPTVEEKRFHDLLCREIGCIACRADGRFNTWVSVHHFDGRTKPWAHWLVLPLCGSHHQDDGSGAISVHPWKARFEAKYGKQPVLLRDCIVILLEKGFAVPDGALRAAGFEVPAAFVAGKQMAASQGRQSLSGHTNN